MTPKITNRQAEIITLIQDRKAVTVSEIQKKLSTPTSIATINRDLAYLVSINFLQKQGKARATNYVITPAYRLLAPYNIETYFDKDPDERKAFIQFQNTVLEDLQKMSVFSETETKQLKLYQQQYQQNIREISPTLYQKEMERLTIELSWKSAQIEGNTYSLLETERLFLERELAKNKTKEEAIMLLNHKKALQYLVTQPDVGNQLSIRLIEEVHSLLIQDLPVSRNIRKRTVGITGTVYKPLDNTFQIREALQKMCELINHKNNAFEKALLSILLISYIQPFEDGNKRTGRMIGNALLIANNSCPLSYRSVSAIDYKKAVLLFYEQNTINAFKNLFLTQSKFSVENYF